MREHSSDRAIAQFVDKTAQIISGAPFPSRRSLAKARELFDLVYATWLLPPIDAAAPEGAQAVAEVTHVAADNYGHRRRIRWLTDEVIPAGSKLYTTQPQPQDAMPRGVQEALQRMIEDGLLRGPASAEDARLVQRWAEQAATPAQGAARDREDAERYRLIRDKITGDPQEWEHFIDTVDEEAQEDAAAFDRAIDAARGAGGGG